MTLPEPYDHVTADTLEVGDQVIIEGEGVTITEIRGTDDIDEVLVIGVSFDTGDTESYPLYADDTYGLWSI